MAAPQAPPQEAPAPAQPGPGGDSGTPRSRRPCVPASPPGEGGGGGDSLAQQLRALEEAKNAAAALKASSELEAGCRRETLRREVPPLRLPLGAGLAEALRKWPSPTTEGEVGSSWQTAVPSSSQALGPGLSAATIQLETDHEAYAGATDMPSPGSPISTEAELHEACRGVLSAVHAAESRATGNEFIVSPALSAEVACAQDPGRQARPAHDAGLASARGRGGPRESQDAAVQRASGPPEARPGGHPEEARQADAVAALGAEPPPARAEGPRREGASPQRSGSPGRRPQRSASPRPASPKPGPSRQAALRPAQPRPASPARNSSPTVRVRDSRRTARYSAAPDSARGPPSRRAPCVEAVEVPPLLSDQEIRAELEQCRRTIASCAQSVTPQSLRELKSLRKPPGAVSSILEATAVLLGVVEAQLGRKVLQGAPPEKREIDLDFREVRKTLQANLPDRIRDIDPEEVTVAQHRRLRKLLAMPGFDEELVRGVCPAAAPLAALCRALGSCLSKIRPLGGGEAGPGAQGSPDAAPAACQGSRAPASAGGAGGEGQEAAGGRGAAARPAAGAPPAAAPGRDPGLVVKPDLSRLSRWELQQVADLTVSRPDIGSIVFHGATDCTELDIPTLVHLGVGEVLVYPGGSKPPPGQGLNKHATVTLLQCWPPNGLGNLEDDESRQRYRRRIQKMTEEKSARFIDYDCLTGVWRFQVEHF